MSTTVYVAITAIKHQLHSFIFAAQKIFVCQLIAAISTLSVDLAPWPGLLKCIKRLRLKLQYKSCGHLETTHHSTREVSTR